MLTLSKNTIENQMGLKSNLVRVLNSTILLVFAYLAVHVISLFTQFAIIKLLGFPNVKLTLTHVGFDSSNPKDWNRLRVVLIYGFPTVLMFFVFVFAWFYRAFTSIKSARVLLFVNWFIVCALSFVLADVYKSPIFAESLRVVFIWYYIPNEFVFVFALLFLPMVPVLALITYRSILKTANSRDWIRTASQKLKYIVWVALIPSLLLCLFVAVLFTAMPNYSTTNFIKLDLFELIVIVLSQVSMLAFAFNRKYVSVDKHSTLADFRWDFLFISTTVIVGIVAILIFMGV